ncbi:MAG: SufD family Fe-S cluster assembly protein [Candidatus Moranbacteria bacterium]|nr:SufD family Fe-S cluster assembly protein [Candidatus Moranbacteria bacterium]
MKFQDISNDKKTLYQLQANEQVVFFLKNRSADIAFELLGKGAEAHVFAFFIGTKKMAGTLTIAQKHLAPKTLSRVLVKSILDDESTFSYRGTLHIAKDAPLSDASQENRNLLLSPRAKAFSEPALEILTSDVRCHHAATTSPLNEEQLFFAEARGLSKPQAQSLILQGFLQSSLDTMGNLISSQDKEKMLALVGKKPF